jgi:hypothetical protein
VIDGIAYADRLAARHRRKLEREGAGRRRDHELAPDPFSQSSPLPPHGGVTVNDP